MIAATPSWLHRLRHGSRVVAAAVCLTLVATPHVDAAKSVDDTPIHHHRAQSLAFEPNRGQSDEQVRFIARGSDYTVFLTATDAVLAPRPRAHGGESQTVRMRLLDANPSPTVVTSNELAGKVNYVPGRGPSERLTDIPTYGTVRYGAVYPHVDLVYHGNAASSNMTSSSAPRAIRA